MRFVFTPPAEQAAGLLSLPLKSISERLARREYRLLRLPAELGVPAVEVVGVAVSLGPGAGAILVTRFLTYAITYRAVFSSPRGGPPTGKLLDALVELLVRLHLSGFFWGDCSLSNALFRYDAGTLQAYLVDTETSEQHPELSAGQRRYERLWDELTREEIIPVTEQRFRIAERLRRLNELGFAPVDRHRRGREPGAAAAE